MVEPSFFMFCNVSLYALKLQITSQCADISIFVIGAVQKLRNAQRGEGVDDFVTYRYVNFEGEGGIL